MSARCGDGGDAASRVHARHTPRRSPMFLRYTVSMARRAAWKASFLTGNLLAMRCTTCEKAWVGVGGRGWVWVGVGGNEVDRSYRG